MSTSLDWLLTPRAQNALAPLLKTFCSPEFCSPNYVSGHPGKVRSGAPAQQRILRVHCIPYTWNDDARAVLQRLFCTLVCCRSAVRGYCRALHIPAPMPSVQRWSLQREPAVCCALISWCFGHASTRGALRHGALAMLARPFHTVLWPCLLCGLSCAPFPTLPNFCARPFCPPLATGDGAASADAPAWPRHSTASKLFVSASPDAGERTVLRFEPTSAASPNTPCSGDVASPWLTWVSLSSSPISSQTSPAACRTGGIRRAGGRAGGSGSSRRPSATAAGPPAKTLARARRLQRREPFETLPLLLLLL